MLICMIKQFLSAGSALTLLRLVNTLYPLVVYTALIRMFSTVEFSKYILTMSVVTVIRLITFFGFESLGVDVISKANRTHSLRKHSYFSSIIFTQIILYFFTIALLCGALVVFSLQSKFVITCLLIPFFEIFRSMWFFLGVREIHHYVRFHLMTGILYVLIFFSFQKHITQIEDVPIIYIGSIILPTTLCWVSAYRKHILIPKAPTLKAMIFLTSRSVSLFKSRALTVLNQESVPFLLGAYGSPVQLIIYDFLRKVVELAKIPNSIINQIVSPIISASQDKVLVRKTLLLRLCISITLYVIAILFIERASILIMPQTYENLFFYMIIYGLLIILAPLNYFYSFAILLPFNHSNKIFDTTLWGTVVLITSLSICHISGTYDLLIFLSLLVAVEAIIVILRFIHIKRYILND